MGLSPLPGTLGNRDQPTQPAGGGARERTPPVGQPMSAGGPIVTGINGWVDLWVMAPPDQSSSLASSSPSTRAIAGNTVPAEKTRGRRRWRRRLGWEVDARGRGGGCKFLGRRQEQLEECGGRERDRDLVLSRTALHNRRSGALGSRDLLRELLAG